MRISIEENKKDVGESQTPGLTSQFTGKTKIEEEGYTYEHYYGNKKYQTFGQDYK